MAYKFQLGPARLSGSVIQEGDIQAESANIEAVEISASLGISASFMQMEQLYTANMFDNGTTLQANAEFNLAGGLQINSVTVSATAAELNVLDGITATTAELNYVDGVTSNIQTQLDGKQASDAGLDYLSGLNITDEASFQEQVGLEIGVDVQAYDPQLATLADMSSSAATAASKLTATEFEALDGIVPGTVVAGLAVVVDSNKDIGDFRDVTGRQFSASADLYAGGAVYAQTIGVADVSGIVQVNGGLSQTDGELHLDPNVAGSGLALASGVLSVDLNEATAGVVAVGADSFLFIDADDNGTKKETVADLMAAAAGDALSATAGVLAVEVDDSSIEVNADALRVKAGGVTNAMLSGSITADKLATGAGLTDVAGALEVSVDNSSIEKTGGTLNVKATGITNAMLAGSIEASKMNNAIFADLEALGAPAADGEFIVATGAGVFAYESGATARTSLGLGTGDSPQFTGLTLTGDLTVQGTTTTINSTVVEIADKNILIASGAISPTAAEGAGLTIDGADVQWKYSEENDAGTITSSNFWIASGSAGLINIEANKIYGTLVGGVLEGVNVFTSSGTLEEGVNKAGAYSSNLNMLLPSNASVGTVVRVKATSNTNSTDRKIQITRQGSDTIDGTETFIVLESPFAAISLIKGTSTEWMVF